MRRFSALAIGVLLLVAWVSFGQGKAKTHTVEMHDDFFKPKVITIAVGDSIVWVNKGEHRHTATADDKSWNTKYIKGGEKSKPIKFEKAGKVPYHCIPHKEEEKMTGTVIVK